MNFDHCNFNYTADVAHFTNNKLFPFTRREVLNFYSIVVHFESVENAVGPTFSMQGNLCLNKSKN